MLFLTFKSLPVNDYLTFYREPLIFPSSSRFPGDGLPLIVVVVVEGLRPSFALFFFSLPISGFPARHLAPNTLIRMDVSLVCSSCKR